MVRPRVQTVGQEQEAARGNRQRDPPGDPVGRKGQDGSRQDGTRCRTMNEGVEGQPGHSKYNRLIEAAKAMTAPTVIVAHPCDKTSLQGPLDAARAGIVKPVLVGPQARIVDIAKKNGIDIDGIEIVDTPHSHASAARAVELIRQGKGTLLMKGSLHTDELMSEVTSSAKGLRTERRISHVFIMDVPGHHETLFITDAAINIF
ncbi:MAG: hypothetical protein KDG54_17805, partial [Geminicoccaceae bacterium]|nr:hypothetical protein [Geminicoccaceae bacterium]